MTEQDAVRQLDFESLARQIFDRFLILRPHVNTEGLFRSGTTYYIVTPATHEPDENGKTLKQWFDGELRTAGAPLELTATRPPNAIQLSERTLQEILDGYGVVRNHSALVRDVAFGLSENFPF